MGTTKFFIEESGNYSSRIIENQLEGLKVFKPNPFEVNTLLNNKLISKASVSERYAAFDFSSFVLEHLDVIEKQFQPESYELKIHKGYQEIRLYRGMEEINGEMYQPMFVIFNSSNCTFPLSVNFGMLRLVCTNGMVVGREGEHFGFKVKHYKNAIQERMASMDLILDDFQGVLQRNRVLIESFSDSTASYSSFLRKMMLNDNNELLKTSLGYAKNLGKKLLNSDSDRLNLEEVNWKQRLILTNPELILTQDENTEDLFISKHQIFQCYTELFRKYNSVVQQKETNKIFNILESMN